MEEMRIQNIGGLDCYEKNGVAYLNLEQAARGLGFTQTQNKSGKEYISIRWETVNRYLSDFGFPNKLGKDAYIPENIFYRLAMKAKNETAEKFQAWVSDKVIPSIRKTGGYIHGAESMTDAELLAKAVLVAQKTIEERNARIKGLEADNATMQAKIKADAPKVQYADAVSESEGGMLVREFAKLLKQNGVDTGEKRLYADLRRRGLIIKAEGRDKNKPTQYAMERGWFTVKETVIDVPLSDMKITRTTTLLTGKGRQYLLSLYLSEQRAAQMPCESVSAN